MRVVSVPTYAQLKGLKAQDLQEADVVVVTYRLFYSPRYLDRLAAAVQETRGDFPPFRFPPPEHESFPDSYETAVRALRAKVSAAGLHSSMLASSVPGHRDGSAVAVQNGGQPPHSMTAKACGKGSRAVRLALAGPLTPDQQPRQRHATTFKARRGTQQSAPARARIATSQPAVASKLGRCVTHGSSSEAELSTPAAKRPRVEPATSGCPPLEAFFWQRVVCDEFHELLRHYPPARVAVKRFRAQHRWGLSGTPPCESVADVQTMADLFNIMLPDYQPNDEGRAVDAAREWLDRFVRQNTTELEPVPIVEELLLVHQSPSERALYLGVMQDQETYAHSPCGSFQEQLLRLCSHFQPSSEARKSASAEEECQQVMQQLLCRLHCCERNCQASVAVASELVWTIGHVEPGFHDASYDQFVANCMGDCKSAVVAAEAAVAAAAAAASPRGATAKSAAATATPRCRLRAKTSSPASNSTAQTGSNRIEVGKRHTAGALISPAELVRASVGTALHEAAMRTNRASACLKKPKRFVQLCEALQLPLTVVLGEGASDVMLQETVRQWKRELSDVMQKIATEMASFESAIRASRFFEAALAARGSAQECGICLEQPQDAVLPCAHGGCFECLTRIAVASAPKCPYCRMDIRPKDVLRVAGTQAGSNENDRAASQKFAKYGSKIQRLVEHLHTIWMEDKDARVIIFVQWEDLKQKLAHALTEFGIRHLVLQGSLWARRAALSDFRAPLSVGHPRALLLSLEASASGTNLTEANHVVLLHPMHASDRKTAVSFEMQAIGRVARPGQTKHVRVWRLVTAHTLEAELTERHQQELWARRTHQAAGVAALASGLRRDGASEQSRHRRNTAGLGWGNPTSGESSSSSDSSGSSSSSMSSDESDTSLVSARLLTTRMRQAITASPESSSLESDSSDAY